MAQTPKLTAAHTGRNKIVAQIVRMGRCSMIQLMHDEYKNSATDESIIDVDCVAALSLPSTMTDSANVASATEGAAPNKPAKLFGLKRSPSSAKVETDIPPMMKRIRISFMMPRQKYPRTLQSLSLKTARHLQARRAWTKIAANELFLLPRCGAGCRRNTAITGSSNPVPQGINRA